MTANRSILVLNRLRGMLHGRGMLTATPEEFAKAMKIPVAEWVECVKTLRTNKRVACNLEKPDRRGRVTIWIQRALKDQRPPRELAEVVTEDIRTLGDVLTDALKTPEPLPEFWGQHGEIDPANPPNLDAVPSTAPNGNDGIT
jgi:hypothetical protein